MSKKKKGKIESIQTWRLKEIQANDYISHFGTCFHDYRDEIDFELTRRCAKQDMLSERKERRNQREIKKQLNDSCPF